MTTAFTSEIRDVGGCRITLKRGGAGRPLLYLHGASGAAQIQPFMQELAREFDVLVPEHPGFGASDEPAWLDSIHDLAYFYLDLLDQLDLREVTVIGSSIGGWLALEIAVRNATRMKALCVIGPSGIHVPGLGKGDIFLWSPEERVRNLFVDQAIAERLLAQTPTPEEQEIAVKNQFTVARLAWEPRLFDPNLHKWLHRIKLPTQIVWGDSDRILPAGYAAEYRKLIPQARVDIIAQCGHLPQTEKPQEFLRLFRDFVAQA
ncbi:MAG: alpha/beta hydrolase [Betaproteobacteria bacterium]|nr:alpha/beta hydrolase [Betaproteobacteria bacterium]